MKSGLPGKLVPQGVVLHAKDGLHLEPVAFQVLEQAALNHEVLV